MELILWLYLLPYDPAYPVVCFDERPCFLIGDVVALRDQLDWFAPAAREALVH